MSRARSCGQSRRSVLWVGATWSSSMVPPACALDSSPHWGARHRRPTTDAARYDVPDASADVVVAFWSAFRDDLDREVERAGHALRPGGRLLVVHDYGRDDVARPSRGHFPSGPWSRRDGPFLRSGFKIRVVHCFWTFESPRGDASTFLAAAFGDVGSALEVPAEAGRDCPQRHVSIGPSRRSLLTADDRAMTPSSTRGPRDVDRRPRDVDPYDPAASTLATTVGDGRCHRGLIFLAIAIVGSIVMVFVISVRDSSQIPLMASGAVVLAIVFGALAVYSLRAVLRAGLEIGQGGRAVLIAFVGGIAAIAAAGFAAGRSSSSRSGAGRPPDPGCQGPSARLAARPRAPIV